MFYFYILSMYSMNVYIFGLDFVFFCDFVKVFSSAKNRHFRLNIILRELPSQLTVTVHKEGSSYALAKYPLRNNLIQF